MVRYSYQGIEPLKVPHGTLCRDSVHVLLYKKYKVTRCMGLVGNSWNTIVKRMFGICNATATRVCTCARAFVSEPVTVICYLHQQNGRPLQMRFPSFPPQSHNARIQALKHVPAASHVEWDVSVAWRKALCGPRSVVPADWRNASRSARRSFIIRAGRRCRREPSRAEPGRGGRRRQTKTTGVDTVMRSVD